jgi:dTDP-4-dehydrorhamnose reductase
MDKATDWVINYLEGKKKKVTQENLKEVASISANDGEIGKLIAEVFKQVGKDGVVTVEEGQSSEIDATGPVNHYGRAKLWGEQFVQTLLQRYYVVRTALVFGSFRPTFIDRVAKCAMTGEPVTAASDIVNSPTYSRDLAQAIAFLIETHQYGVLHIANEGQCSRHELAEFVAEALGQDKGFIQKGDKHALSLKAPRPGYTPLENFVWKLNGFPKIRTWQEAAIDYLDEFVDA